MRTMNTRRRRERKIHPDQVQRVSESLHVPFFPCKSTFPWKIVLVLKPTREKEQVACSSKQVKVKAEEKAEVVTQENSNPVETFGKIIKHTTFIQSQLGCLLFLVEAVKRSASEILVIIGNTDCRLDMTKIKSESEKKVRKKLTLESATTVMDSIEEYDPDPGRS
jgi:hypothetical protein